MSHCMNSGYCSLKENNSCSSIQNHYYFVYDSYNELGARVYIYIYV